MAGLLPAGRLESLQRLLALGASLGGFAPPFSMSSVFVVIMHSGYADSQQE
jgi:hypothetical protein